MDTKGWWTSKTMWGAIVLLATVVLGYFGVVVSAEEQGAMIDGIVQIAIALQAVIGLILVIIGRLKADTKLTLHK